MRIDKFLWCVRFYKTRTMATDELKKNRISIAGKPVKASKEIMPGDVIGIRKNQIDYKIKVIQIPASRLGAKLVSLYVSDQTPTDQYELLKERRLVQNYYRAKGEGRPTKKDRRDIDDYTDGPVINEDQINPNPPNDEENWADFFQEQD
jgi:ribosome-associated heat shock protein Hsp15